MANYNDPENPWGEEYKQMIQQGMLGLDEGGVRQQKPRSSSAKAERSRTAARQRTSGKRTARSARAAATRRMLEEMAKNGGRIPASPTR